MEQYKHKKVITIGIVQELTGLTIRTIRYYEERGLISPERSDKGNRKYSFADVEQLIRISAMRQDGVQTFEIKQYLKKQRENGQEERQIKKKMLQGQLNSYFKNG